MAQLTTFLAQNKFYSAVDIPSAADEAGASAHAPTPDVPAEISSSCGCVEGHAERDQRLRKSSLLVVPPLGPNPSTGAIIDSIPMAMEVGIKPGSQETAAIDSCQEPVAADLLQALGALSGTDLIHEIFAVKPKHFKLKHKRRTALPRFAPDYEAMDAAMHDPSAPRALEGDPVWADASPLFLKDA